MVNEPTKLSEPATRDALLLTFRYSGYASLPAGSAGLLPPVEPTGAQQARAQAGGAGQVLTPGTYDGGSGVGGGGSADYSEGPLPLGNVSCATVECAHRVTTPVLQTPGATTVVFT